MRDYPNRERPKISPEIIKYIELNSNISCRVLSKLIHETFGVYVSHVTVSKYLEVARDRVQADNNAKAEAVRAQLLEKAGEQAQSHLAIVNDEINAWVKLLKEGSQEFSDGRKIEINSVRDRAEASRVLKDYVKTLMDFVQPMDASLILPKHIKLTWGDDANPENEAADTDTDVSGSDRSEPS